MISVCRGMIGSEGKREDYSVVFSNKLTSFNRRKKYGLGEEDVREKEEKESQGRTEIV